MGSNHKLLTLYNGIHQCTLCHGLPRGTIKPDPKKVVRQVFPRIIDSKVFMVAQSLAKSQVRLSGIPFHGADGTISKGGRFLERYLNIIGYTIIPESTSFQLIYSTDIVQCYPGRRPNGQKGDNVPTPKEIDNCRNWLHQELSLFKPKVVILFGGPAGKMFMKHYLNSGFTKLGDYFLKPQSYVNASVFFLPHPTSYVVKKSLIYEETFHLIRNVLLED